MEISQPIQRIALTPGEPAGIGPDLCVMLAQQSQPCEIVAIACPDVLEARAQRLGLPLTLNLFNHDSPAKAYNSKRDSLIIFLNSC